MTSTRECMPDEYLYRKFSSTGERNTRKSLGDQINSSNLVKHSSIHEILHVTINGTAKTMIPLPNVTSMTEEIEEISR